MTNSEALKRLCNAMCNTFYPDDGTLSVMLMNEGVQADGEATPKDEKIFRMAVSFVFGYVEGSRTENGISTSVLRESVKESIKYWCNLYGLDADEILGDYIRVISNGSNLW